MSASRQQGTGRASGKLVMLSVIALVLGVVAQFGVAPAYATDTFSPSVTSDLADYNPGGTVTLTGKGWDAGGEPVHIVVNDDDAQSWQHVADVAAPDGTLTDVFQLPSYFVANYSVVATQAAADGSVLKATHTFTDANAAANLDQCANDPYPSPSSDGCSGSASDWINGNMGSSKAVYFEGDSLPYRMRFENLSLASHTVTIEWDTTKGGTHALDYLTSFDRTVATANPCLGVTGCDPATFTTLAIPADPQVTGSGITPVTGSFTLFGGTVNAVSAYSYADGTGFTGDKSARITLTFTPTVDNPVLAWAGHISSRKDWGANNSAVAIPGSPYHTRLIGLDGSGGNQDRSLSADAVIFPGSITVIKDATPNGSQAFSFTGSPSPLANFTLTDDGTTTNTKVFDKIVTFQTYTVAEAAQTAPWVFDGADCSVTTPNGGSQSVSGSTTTINLKEGENVTCTYLNHKMALPSLTLVKTVTNDNGGTADKTDFTLSAAGPKPISGPGGVSSSVDPGTYTLSETNLPGYKAGSWSCVGGTFTGPDRIALDYNDSATCTIDNNDNTAHLKLVKTVTNDNGGAAKTTDFTLSADGPTPISGAGGAESDVNAGAYDLSETNLPGYTAGSWSCTGGTQSGAEVTLALGESATCTINNNDKAAHLKLVKTVTNDNGGTAAATDFDLSAAGPTPISGPGGADKDVNAGSYSLSETNLPGYTAGSWSCTGGTFTAPDKLDLALGASATCTIDNNDNTAHLKLVKTVTNDNGGTAKATDFTLSAAGPTPVSGAGGADMDVDSGTYTLSETNVPGYTAGSWSCVGGTPSGAKVTLALGESATCTINNNDDTAHLKLVKVVENDNGGTAVATDFTLSAAGPTPVSGAGGADKDVNAGTYSLSETSVTGYTGGVWFCEGGTQNGADIALELGESATCTIANRDDTPHLTLVKTVTNDNGGTAVATDFTLSAAGPTPISGAGGADKDVNVGSYTLSETNLPGYTAGSWSCTGSGTFTGPDELALALGESATCTIDNNDDTAHLKLVKTVTNDNGGTAKTTDFMLAAAGPTPVAGAGGTSSDVNAGSYTLSETNLPGYSAGSWSCTGGTFTGPDEIALALGESATCTINNNDDTAHLKLVKTVTNDNGGTAKATDFTLSAEGHTPISGAGGTESDVNAGEYTLSETNLAGYTAGSWSCDGGTQSGAKVTLALGESATCTINNNDVTAHLTLVKTVTNDNGGTAVATDFTVSAAGPTPISGVGGKDSDVNAGNYTLSETDLPGYTAGSWSCTGGTFTGPDEIALALGESASCTINNNDRPPVLHLRKLVVNDNGGTKTAADFTLTANGTGSNDLTGTASVDSGSGLQADTWALSETNVYGYTASAWSCVGGMQSGSNITVGIGGEATCTITNDDQPGTVVVKKVSKPVNTGSFAFTTTGTGYTGFTIAGGGQNSQTLDAGTYTVRESTQLGWILTGIGGSTDPATPYRCVVTGRGGSTGVGDLNTQTATISLKNGDTVTCTFENTGQGVTRTQGFWATHPQLAQIAWFGGTAFGHTFPGVASTAGIGDELICGRSVDTLAKVTGTFWSDISKKSTGAKRTALDQGRMQLLQQLIAAELNASAFGSVPSGGSGTFANWETALCGTNQTAIKTAQQRAASFNTTGDSGTFTPGTSADSRYARSIADIPFWNTIKP